MISREQFHVLMMDNRLLAGLCMIVVGTGVLLQKPWLEPLWDMTFWEFTWVYFSVAYVLIGVLRYFPIVLKASDGLFRKPVPMFLATMLSLFWPLTMMAAAIWGRLKP